MNNDWYSGVFGVESMQSATLQFSQTVIILHILSIIFDFKIVNFYFNFEIITLQNPRVPISIGFRLLWPQKG